MWDQIAVAFLLSGSVRHPKAHTQCVFSLCSFPSAHSTRSSALLTYLSLLTLPVTKGQEGDPPPIAVP